MQLIYNSDSYVVVHFDVPGDGAVPGSPRAGFDIVDKFGRREVFLEGAVAERFQRGVAELAQQHPQGTSAETLDDYIATFTALAAQPLVQH